MRDALMPIGRRERAKQDKRERIMAAARELFAEHGVGGVTTQQVADRADVAIGTLYRYAATKAELLINDDAVLSDIREQVRITLSLRSNPA